MANATRGKVLLVAAGVACACALAAAPAFAFYYVHDEELAQEDNKGVIEIAYTLDETAVDGGVSAGVILVPEGSTAEDCLKEAVEQSTNQNGLDAIHDYSTSRLADYLSGKSYTCTVYSAESQEPGTQTTHDGSGTEGADTPLERYDNVVITVEA